MNIRLSLRSKQSVLTVVIVDHLILLSGFFSGSLEGGAFLFVLSDFYLLPFALLWVLQSI